MQPPIRNPNPHHEFLKPLLDDSTKQFLTQHRSGRTDFSDFESIFTRLLKHHPDPPLELLWFYSAVVFHSSKPDFGYDSVRLTRSLFQMLVPLSEPFSGAKRVAMLSPLVYHLIRLFKIGRRREDVSELLDAIVGYVSVCCRDEQEDGLLMVTGFSFADLSRVWVVDQEEGESDDCLEMFMPFVGERLRREVGSESCSVGCLAGIVASQLLLLNLCLRFDSGKDLRESVVGMISGFHSCYFFDGILKMLLVEPDLRLTPLLVPEDEAALIETITEAVIVSAERLFLNTGSGDSQRSLQLKNIAINWLFLFGKVSLRYAYSYFAIESSCFRLLETPNDHTGKLKIRRKPAGT
ncbi:SNF2 domain protein [Hirschfeldia incana]|nr:SNF2 domain protein [Hirschfeldia incana]